MMIALCLVALLAVSTVFAATDPFAAFGGACIKVTQSYPLKDDLGAWKGAGDTPIRGYYKKISSTVYKKTNDINCKDITKMNKMWFKKSGSSYYFNPTKSATSSNARFKGCKTELIWNRFPMAICNPPGNGPAPSKKMKLSISSAAASKCATMWATTNYADGLIVDAPLDYVSPVDDEGFFDQIEVLPDNYDDDDEEEDIFGDEVDEQPEFDAPAFDDDYEQQPKLAAPTFEQQPNEFTLTIGKWTLLIASLVMANIAVIMTILYCKEKNKAVVKFTEF